MMPRLNTHVPARLAAVSFLAVLVLAACSGNDAPDEPVRPEDASCEPLKEFESFRYTYNYKIDSPQPESPVDETAVGDPPFAIGANALTVTLEQRFDGAYRQPDSYMVNIDTAGETDTPPIELIFIGGSAWVNLGEWQQTETFNTFPPMGVCEAVLTGLDLTGLSGSQETINGEAVTHFRREDAQLDIVSTLFDARSDMGRLVKSLAVDVWLAEEGWPVRLEAKGAGPYPSGREMRVELSLELKDINSDDIKISAPQ